MFFDFWGPNLDDETNPISAFRWRPAPCSACGFYDARQGDDLCDGCATEVERMTASCMSRINLMLAQHAEFDAWEESRRRDRSDMGIAS
jgi:hypothetical protein